MSDVATERARWLCEQGWSVAVHNYYRFEGVAHTFWLWTHPNGRWIKGEGFTDADALQQCVAATRPVSTGDDVATVRMVECVQTWPPGEAADPIWRIEIDGYCADFEHEQAARNFADAINRAALTTLPDAVLAERERCAKVAECHSDDRPYRASFEWNDGYQDGCRGAAAAIRSRGE